MQTSVLACVLCLGAFAGANGAEVILRRSNPSGVEMAGIPVSVGIPFAVGELADAGEVALVDGDGNAVACQAEVTSRWWSLDGSAQTVLVTFLADTRQEKYILRYGAGVGPGPRPRRPVTAVHEGEAVVVKTGALVARLGAAGSGFIEHLAYDANGDGEFSAEETVVDASRPGTLRCGEFSSAFGAPEQLEIEQAGPVRAVVRIRGHHRSEADEDFIGYDVRLTFYAGSSLIRVDHTFLQDTSQIFADLPFVSLDLPLASEGGAAVAFGLEANGASPPRSPSPSHTTLRRGGRTATASRSESAPTTAEARGERGRTATASRSESAPTTAEARGERGGTANGIAVRRSLPRMAQGRVVFSQVGPGQKEMIAGLKDEEFKQIVEERKVYWSAEEEARWTRGPEITEWAVTVSDEETESKVGQRAAGWMRVTPEGKPWAITAGVRYCWQLHPKAFALDKGALRIFAYPDTLGRPLHLHIGTAKTHTMFLLVHPAKDMAAAEATTEAFFDPPMYLPAPQWYCDSRVWGDVLPRREGAFSLYESEVERTIRSEFKGRAERGNGYGMLNFGDFAWGGNKWGNLETAADHGVAVQFIRTGERELFDMLERAVWHFRDVAVQQAGVPGRWDWGLWLIPGYMPEKLARLCAEDEELREEIFYWTGTQPPEIGGVHRHSYMHFANAAYHPVPSSSRYEHKRLRMYSGSCDVGGHGWIVGLVDHYLLTGDRRSLEVAELAGQWVLRRGGTHWGRDNWKYVDLAWLYRATGKKEYLDRLLEAIDGIYADRASISERIATRDKTLISPFYTILQFIKHVHQMTGDPGVREKYLDLLDRWIDNVPYTDSHIGPVFQYIRGFRDSRCHTDFADLAYAYLLTGDREYLDRSLNSLDFYLHFAYHSTAFFSVPEYLYALEKAGLGAFGDPAPTVKGERAFWQDEADGPVHLVVYQQSGYRVAAEETTGEIKVTSPSGKATATAVERSGLDVYRITVPPDGETGTYKIEAKAEGCSFGFGADVVLLNGPPPVLVEGKFGKGVRLADGAKLDLPAEGHLNLDEGTIELWFQPDWNAPSGRAEAVPYHYHQLFDSRDSQYDYGFVIYLWDGGEVGAGKSLIAMWADRDKAENVQVGVEWKKGEWHHIAFAWKRTGEGIGQMRLYLDGKLVGEKENAANFPTKFSPVIRLGKNATDSPNTSANGVIDELRVSRVTREPTTSGPLEADEETLLLEGFEAWRGWD